MTSISELRWDSNFLKRKVGEVDLRFTSLSHVESLEKAVQAKYSLVYIKSPSELDTSQASDWKVFDSGGSVELKKQLQGKECRPNSCRNGEVSIIDNIECISDSLLYLCGAKSRFFRDPDIRIEDFQFLYRTWLSADLEDPRCSVVGHMYDNEIISFGSIKYGRSTASISLIAVSPEHQGKGLGKDLVKWMEGKAQRAGLDDICVKTQMINKSALSLYMALGFTVTSQYELYHAHNLTI